MLCVRAGAARAAARGVPAARLCAAAAAKRGHAPKRKKQQNYQSQARERRLDALGERDEVRVFESHRPGLHRGVAALTGSQLTMWGLLTYYNHTGAFAEAYRVSVWFEVGGAVAALTLAGLFSAVRERSVAEIHLRPGGREVRLGFHTVFGGLRHETVPLADISFNAASTAEKATTYTFKLPERRGYFVVDKKGKMNPDAMRRVFGPLWSPPPPTLYEELVASQQEKDGGGGGAAKQ